MILYVVDKFNFILNYFHALCITWIKFRCLIYTWCVWITSKVWGLACKALLSFTPSYSYKLILCLFFCARCTFLPMFYKTSRSLQHMVSFYKLVHLLGMSSTIYSPPLANWHKSKTEGIDKSFSNKFIKTLCVLSLPYICDFSECECACRCISNVCVGAYAFVNVWWNLYLGLK